MAKEYLDYNGLFIYHDLIKKIIDEHEIDLKELKLTDDFKFEIHFTKCGVKKSLSLDLSSLVTEWKEL